MTQQTFAERQIAVYRRAADAVQAATDWEAEAYAAQAAVEWWALDALQLVAQGNLDDAEALIEAFDGQWEKARCYPRDGECEVEDCSNLPLACSEDGAFCNDHAPVSEVSA